MKSTYILLGVFFIFNHSIAQLTSYKAEDEGYFSNIIESNSGYILTANQQNDIYLLQNGMLTNLISAPGCGKYLQISPDRSLVGFKYIQKDGLQQPAVLDLNTKKINYLYQPVKQCGQPIFDNAHNIYFTIGNQLIKYQQTIVKTFHLPLYVNYLQVSGDGKLAAFADDNKGIYLLNLENQEIKLIGTPACFYPQFSHDGRYLAYASNPNVLFVYDILQDNTLGPYEITGFKWHPTENKIIGIHSTSKDFEIISSDIWELSMINQKINKISNSTELETGVNYDKNGNILYSILTAKSIYKQNSYKQKSVLLQLSSLNQSFLYPQKSTKSDVTVPGTVPYVHQVYDTPTWHSGYGSCAPTTSIMALAYYNRLPKWSVSVDHGQSWDPHVNDYGSYVADRYRFNEWYYEEIANDYAGNTSYGGYGYMWTGSYSPSSRMKNYIQNHYLTSNQYWTTSCTFTATTTEIDNGYVHPICCYLTSSGHLVLAIGYISGQHTLIFNDPYGNKNTPGYPNYNGAYSYYDWPGYNNGYQNLDNTGSYGYVAWTVAARGTQPVYSDTIIDDNHFNHGFYMNNVNNGSHMRYFRDFNVGYGSHSWYTLGMASGTDICYCTWTPTLQQNGYYTVSAFIPPQGSNTTNASYKIYHENGIDIVVVNQNTHRNQWVNLGTYYFTTSGQKYVYLGDLTGTNGDSIAFDCVKFSPASVDNVAPTTSISTTGQWKTQDFSATFTDNDNVSVEKAFYQVLDYNGTYWSANTQRGFLGDNFDILQPMWSVYTGTWNVSNGELIQSNENEANANIYAPLNQNLSNRYLYQFRAKVNGSGTNRRFGFHFFCDNGNLANRGNSYFIWFRVEDQTMEFYEVTNDVIQQQSVINNVVTTPDQWYDFKITYDRISGKICVWRNNIFMGSWTDTTPYSTNGNYISFRTGNCIMNIDELKVYRSRYPSLTVTLGDSTKDIRYQNPNPSTSSAKIKSIVVDANNNLSTIAYHDLNVDWTAPDSILLVNDGNTTDVDSLYTPAQVEANWTVSADTNSNIAYYSVALGTTPCSDNIVNWTNAGLNNSYTFNSLSLMPNQNYYIGVKATNNAGLTNNCSCSDGFKLYSTTVADFYAVDTLLYLPNAYALFVNNSVNALNYLWTFGDGTTSTEQNPFHLYMDTGYYTVTLKAIGTYFSDSTAKPQYIHVKDNTSIAKNNNDNIKFYPNPVKDKLNINIISSNKERVSFKIKDILGKTIKTGFISTNKDEYIDFSGIPKGYYMIAIDSEKVKKLSIIKQ